MPSNSNPGMRLHRSDNSLISSIDISVPILALLHLRECVFHEVFRGRQEVELTNTLPCMTSKQHTMRGSLT